jgi:uncharacterized protein YbaA (DUF1428 family)
MENQKNTAQAAVPAQETEKIVSLNEDSKSHQHDDASYEKLMAASQQEKK